MFVICRSGRALGLCGAGAGRAGWQTVNVSDGMTGWAVACGPMISETGAEPYVGVPLPAVTPGLWVTTLS